MTFASRGQALVETTIFLPLTLFTLFGVIWAAQYGVMSERVESSIRYSGLISNQLNPYVQYSFYVLYNSVGSTVNSPLPAQTCNPPVADALSNSGVYPGPSSGPFWQATPVPPTAQCFSTPSRDAVFNNSGMNQTAIALSNTPIVQAEVKTPTFLQSVLQSANLPAGGSLNFIKPADMSTMMNCYPSLQTTLLPSLQPTPLGSASPSTTPVPIAEPAPAATPIPETC